MSQRFAIQFSASAKREFEELDVFIQRRVSDAIDQKLSVQPNQASRHRKLLGSERANFGFDPPLWELRVDVIRVFYTVSLDDLIVVVCAVRRKPPEWTTSKVLNEDRGH